MQRLLYFISLLLIVFLVGNCANISAPKGGPKDETPPRIIKEETTPNLQTNFTKQIVKFTFDEWVKLDNAVNQVVVSPPLEFKPNISLRKRSVLFEFDEREVLRKDATYTINFGDSVKDITEGNEAKDMRFVFSTGDFIDSLKVTGNVHDAFTNEAVKDVFVLLYENLADSVFLKDRPFYFGKTDESGNFQINNVKSGTFKVCALVESLVDYKYNGEDEQIGFLDEPIEIDGKDFNGLSLSIFSEQQAMRILTKDVKNYGVIKLHFNQDPKDVEFDYDDVGQTISYEYEKDSVILWYTIPEDNSWNLYIQYDTVLNDTIKIKALSSDQFFENAVLTPIPAFSTSNLEINPFKAIELTFNHPIARIDTGNIQLLEDTLNTLVLPQIELDSLNKRVMRINHTWKEERPYQLLIQPGAITDIFGIENDSLEQQYLVNTKNSLASINMTVDDLDTNQQYVLQLFTKDDIFIDKQIIKNDSVFKKLYTAMETGEYKLHLITDKNANGQWDAGNYAEGLQAEPILIKNLDKLRANWELELQLQPKTKKLQVAPSFPSVQDSLPSLGLPKKKKKDKE